VRRIGFILTLIFAFTLQANASHILGGEITYEHQKDLKYKVYVTVYRDCSECKIANGGGGPSSKDCGSFDLFLKSSDRGECSSTSLGRYALTRESIRTILPVCSSSKSLCEDNSGEPIGVEAHQFYTTVDFEQYRNYKKCGFEFFVQIASRADDINNLSTGGQMFYNYAYINPFMEHSSPTFSDNPELYLSVNQPVRTLVTGANPTTDSTVIKFGNPLRASNTSITFQSGYSRIRPISVWCNGDTDCQTKEWVNPPIGMYLNRETGQLIFTPVKSQEKATLVFEIEKWQTNDKGEQVLVSLVRRDVLVEVIQLSAQNNPPTIVGDAWNNQNVIEVCEGQELCFDVKASDMPFKFPNGTYQKQNTVSFDWQTTIDGASIKEVSTASAPFNKLNFCWKPESADAGKSFELIVRVLDNNCPFNATQTEKFIIQVKERDEPEVLVRELWCGNLMVSVDGASESITSANWVVKNHSNDVIYDVTSLSDTFKLNEVGTYNVFMTAEGEFGCGYKFEDAIRINKDDISVPLGNILGKKNWCIGDTVRFSYQPKSIIEIDSYCWVFKKDTTTGTNEFSYVANGIQDLSPNIEITAKGRHGDLECRDRQIINVELNFGPKVEFDEDAGFCLNDASVELSQFVNVKTGVWKAIDHNYLSGSTLDPSTIQDKQTSVELCQQYDATDPATGCVTRDTLCVWGYELPELIMANTFVCGNSGFFNLKNLTRNSFHNEKLSWTIDGADFTGLPGGDPNLVELSSLGIGTHNVVCTFTNEFGCSVKDSAVLTKLKELDISYITDKEICQSGIIDLNNLFGLTYDGGNWTTASHYGMIHNNQLDDTACGNVSLNYTYDRFGCYATKDVVLGVQCKPEIELQLDDTICSTFDEYVLVANPDIGWFSGDNVVDNKLVVGQLRGTQTIRYNVNIKGCAFDYETTMEIVPAPEFTINPGFMFDICEGENIELRDIRVENGWLRLTTRNGELDFTEFPASLSYKPNLTDILLGNARFEFQPMGVGMCPVSPRTERVTIHPTPRISLRELDYNGCEPYEFKAPTFNWGNRVDWATTDVTWDYGDGNIVKGKQPEHTYTEHGTYSLGLTAVTAQGCRYERNWDNLVEVHPTPVAGFTHSAFNNYVSVKRPNVSFVNNSTCADEMTYQWDFGTPNPADRSTITSPEFAFKQDTGKYLISLTATTAKGCADQAFAQIWVGPDIQLFVPNAFSPNGLGPEEAEEFKVIGNFVKSYHIEIYNRWGNRVYESDDINEEWDGKAANSPCATGVYVYYIQAVSLTGEFYELNGTLNLVR
jgi:gliding motility-associated-like protein